ncbi:MAG: Gfo/Idh/MocA family oxidoreductase [Bacteroidales bacterium]
MFEKIDINRRQFIGNLGTYTSGLVLMGGLGSLVSSCSSDNEKETAPFKVKIGVIGTGSRGQLLLDILTGVSTAEIIAVCDNYEPNLKIGLNKTQGKAKSYSNHKEMLDKEHLDAVIIATPLYEHARIALDAFSAGLHVYCEKSMARTVEECTNMVKASESSGKVFLLGLQRQFDPTYLIAMQLIQNNFIGKLTQVRAYWHRNNNWRRLVPSPELERKINWRLYNEYSCGLMTELASHHIHIANWALNSTPIRVMGSGSINYWNDGREVFDNVNVVYEYPGGIHLNYDSLTSNKYYGAEVQIMGDKGTFELETGLFYSENPPPSPAMVQMIMGIENGLFEAINFQGTSWAAEQKDRQKPSRINPNKKLTDGTKELLTEFTKLVKAGKPVPELTKRAFNASVATLYGDLAMKEKRIIEIPEEHKM